MAAVSFWRRLILGWRSVAQHLWPERPEETLARRSRLVTARLERLQQRMLYVRRYLERLATALAHQTNLRTDLERFISARLNSPDAVAAALQLEQVNANLAQLAQAIQRHEGRYQRLRERYAALRARLRTT